MKEIAYVNGVFCDIADAVVSIEDRGFQFADGVYEVLVAPGGRPFRMAQHLERLRHSTEAIEMRVDYSAMDLPSVIRKGIELSGFADTLIYLQITRGVMPRDHLYRDGLPPTVVATFKAKPMVSAELRRAGVALETVRDFRWERCYIKSVALLPNVLIKNAARRRGFFDALLVSDDGTVRETSAANIFMVRKAAGGGMVVRTPPADERILHGVTRNYILECARGLALTCEESDFAVEDLIAADEAFLSSTTMDIMPVTRIDGQSIGGGNPGPISSSLLERFYEGMKSDRNISAQMS
jgi:D-alanine transaminase